VCKITSEMVVREALGRFGLSEGKDFRLIEGKSTTGTLGSVTFQLGDSEESKKFWESPLGFVGIEIVAMILIMLFQEYREGVRSASSEKLVRDFKSTVEEYLQAKNQPQLTAKPAPVAKQHPVKRGNPRRKHR
jgi:hypothetical protein